MRHCHDVEENRFKQMTYAAVHLDGLRFSAFFFAFNGSAREKRKAGLVLLGYTIVDLTQFRVMKVPRNRWSWHPRKRFVDSTSFVPCHV